MKQKISSPGEPWSLWSFKGGKYQLGHPWQLESNSLVLSRGIFSHRHPNPLWDITRRLNAPNHAQILPLNSRTICRHDLYVIQRILSNIVLDGSHELLWIQESQRRAPVNYFVCHQILELWSNISNWIWLCCNLNRIWQFQIQTIADTDAFSFSFLSMISTLDLVMKTSGSSTGLTCRLQQQTNYRHFFQALLPATDH